jgi:subtilisin family serine protease
VSLKGFLAKALDVPVSALAAGALQPVKIAIIDSGIDSAHPDLAGKVEAAFWCKPERGRKITTLPMPPNTNNDAYGHGTAVASIIARIAPNTSFIDIRVLGANTLGAPDALLAGIDHANYTDVRLMNISVAVGEAYAKRMLPLIDRAHHRGKMIVAATRNRPLEDEGYPASMVHSIGVGNAGRGPEREWRWRRDIIEFMGYGVDVPVAASGGGYTTQTGTSFATPIICGIVALMLGAHPDLTLYEVKALLKAFAVEPAPAG